jgi:MoaA/NifB/PqqE/SkfB family radical SAM enzyme
MINDPPSIEIELTSKCTLFCAECPRTKDSKEEEHLWNFGEIPLDTIKSLLENIPDTRNIIFSGAYGDPIYHSKFIEIMELCKINQKKVTVNTNGSYRNSEWWTRLAQTMGSNVCFVFSVDGLEDTNKIYRVNSDWPSILNGMKIMTQQAETPIEWKWILFRQNQDQVEEAYRLSKEIGIRTFTVIKSGRPFPPGMEPTVPLEEVLDKLEKAKNNYDSRP